MQLDCTKYHILLPFVYFEGMMISDVQTPEASGMSGVAREILRTEHRVSRSNAKLFTVVHFAEYVDIISWTAIVVSIISERN